MCDSYFIPWPEQLCEMLSVERGMKSSTLQALPKNGQVATVQVHDSTARHCGLLLIRTHRWPGVGRMQRGFLVDQSVADSGGRQL